MVNGQVTYDYEDVLTQRPSLGENSVWHYFTEEEGHLVNGELSPRFESLLNTAGFENIRYPGGTVSDLYDWKKTLPNISNRPPQLTHIWRTYPATAVGDADATVQLGVNEILKMAHASGASIVPVFSPNYNMQHHLDLYEYLTAESNEDLDGDGVFWGQLRESYGIGPVEAPVVEYGNELFGSNHYVWYMQGNNGLPRGGGPVDDNKALNGGIRVFTNQMAHKERGTPIISDVAGATFASEGLENEEFSAFFPPINSMAQAKVGTNFNDASTYELFTPVLIPEGVDPASVNLLSSYGPNDSVFLYRKSDGLIIFGDGVNGKRIPSGVNVFLDYDSGPHTGYLDLYNALKIINPDIVVSDGAYLNTQSKDAFPIHGGFQFRNAVGLIDDNIVTEMVSKGYFSWGEHLQHDIDEDVKNIFPVGTQIVIGEHASLDFGPGASRTTLDADGVEHRDREYTILGAIQHVLECERMITQFGMHTDYPVTVFNKTSMTNQAYSIRSNANENDPSTQFNPDNLFTTSLGVAQEFFIKHTGKLALKSTANTIPTSTMNFRKLSNINQSDQGSIPDFIPYVSRDEDGEYIYLTAINPSASVTYTPSFTLDNVPSTVFSNTSMEATLMHADNMLAVNSPTERNNIRIDVVSTNDVTVNTNLKTISFSLPPLSAKTIKIYAGDGTTGSIVTPPTGLVQIQNEELKGWLEATNLPDPTGAGKNEVRLNSNTDATPTLWQFVDSNESGWYYVRSETGYLQLTNISDPQGNTSGLALRTRNSVEIGGSWLKWRLVESATSGAVHIENKEFQNYVRATQEVQNASIPAYFVHGASTQSNGGWAQWKLVDLVEIPSSWTYIDNMANLSETRLKQAPNTDATGQEVDLNLAPNYTGNWVQWKLVPVTGTSYYHVEGRGNPLRLQIVAIPETKSGIAGYATRLVPNTYSGDLTQWEVISLDDGISFSLKSKSFGYYLSATNLAFNNQSNELEVYAIPNNNDIKTHWSFASISGTQLIAQVSLLVDDSVSESNLAIYPNPVTQGALISVELDSQIEKEEEMMIQVLNFSGIQMFENTVPFTPGHNKFYIDTAILTSGIYFIKMKSNSQEVNKKIIIE